MTTALLPRTPTAVAAPAIATSQQVTLYGVGDDRVQVVVDNRPVEQYAARRGPTTVRLSAPDGSSMDVVLEFGRRGAELDWTVGVRAGEGAPSWPVRFHPRHDRRTDPAVTLTVPIGTQYAPAEASAVAGPSTDDVLAQRVRGLSRATWPSRALSA